MHGAGGREHVDQRIVRIGTFCVSKRTIVLRVLRSHRIPLVKMILPEQRFLASRAAERSKSLGC